MEPTSACNYGTQTALEKFPVVLARATDREWGHLTQGWLWIQADYQWKSRAVELVRKSEPNEIEIHFAWFRQIISWC
jgi:hypothetical protein